MARYLVGLAAALLAGSACAAELSPEHWLAQIRTDVERQEAFRYPPYARAVESNHGLVTGTLSPIGVHAGSEALRQGGTAADAVATAALTEIMTDAGGAVTYAGVFQLLYYDAKTKKVYALDAQWAPYAQETDPATIPDNDSSPGAVRPTRQADLLLGRDTLVPGLMAGVEAMHMRFGRLPFADLFQPAIWYAEHGIVVSTSLGASFERNKDVLWRTPAGRRFASLPSGRLPKEGDIYPQPDAARTLRAVARQGAAYMYTGDWAHAFVAAVRDAGGKASLDDLARYRAVWREPYSLPFEGTRVYGIGENDLGGCPTLEALNVLSTEKVEKMGPYWSDPKAFAAYVRAIRLGFYRRDFPRSAPAQQNHSATAACTEALSPQFAKATIASIEAATATPNPDALPGHHSDAVIAIDRWGDVAVLVHSSNTVGWGITGLVVGGVPIPDPAGYPSTKVALAAAKPDARLPSGMGPVIALQGGKPVLAIAAIGYDLVPETVRLVGGLLAGRQDLQTVMSAPELLLSSQVSPDWKWPEPVPAGAYDPELLKAVEAQGLATKAVPPANDGRGLAAAVVLDPAVGSAKAVEAPTLALFAESDPRRLIAPPPLATPQTLDRYVGVFKVGRKVVRVRRDGAYLTAAIPGVAFLLPFSAVASQEFVSESANARVTFDPVVDGVSKGLVFHINGVDSPGARIGEDEAARIEATTSQK